MIKKLLFASALIISAALVFVACSSDESENDKTLAMTTWTLEGDGSGEPVSISIVSEKEGIICSAFKMTGDDGKEYTFETRMKFTYQQVGGKYSMNINAVAAEHDGKWETIGVTDEEYNMAFTVNKQAKTMTLLCGDDTELTAKQTTYVPVSWPGSAPVIPEVKTKDDALGTWVGGMFFPIPDPVSVDHTIIFSKKNDNYSASGRVKSSVRKKRGELVRYDISFRGCSYTVDNGTIVVENIENNTKLVIKSNAYFFGVSEVYRDGRKSPGLPAYVFRASF